MKKKLDEMERSIKVRSQSFGFRIAILLLSVWTLYESYLVLFTEKQRLYIVPCLLLTLLNAAVYFAELIMKRKAIAGDEEYKEPNKLVLSIIKIAALAAILVFITSLLIMRLG